MRKKLDFDRASITLKRSEAIKRLAFRRTYEDDTNADIEARLHEDAELSASRLEANRLENQYESLVYQVDSMKEQLNSVKLIARLKMAEIGGLGGGRE